MKCFASLVLASLCIGMPLHAVAQTGDGPVTIVDFEDGTVTADSCWFLEDSVSEIVGEGANYSALFADLRDAEGPVQDYVTMSLRASEDAAGMALRDFSDWYRYQVAQNSEHELPQRVIEAFVQKALEEGMSAILPGSGLLVSSLRAAGGAAISAFTSEIRGAEAPDPETYLDRIADRMQDDNANMQMYLAAMFHDITDQRLMDQVETIKFEYVMERRRATRLHDGAGARLTPASCTGQMLEDMGIRRPTPANALAVREAILFDLINRARCEQLRGNPFSNCERDMSENRGIARAAARRLIYVGRDNISRMYNLTDHAQLESVCRLEPLSSPIDGDCRRWRASR